MKFFLDENFPKSVGIWLSGCGHEVFDIRGSRHEGMPDTELFSQAQAVGAVILTTDRDFFHTVPHLFERHAGVVVVALSQPNRKNILVKMEWVMDRFKPSDFVNRAIQLRDKTWIAVPPLDDGI